MRSLLLLSLFLMIKLVFAQNSQPHHLYFMNQSTINPAYTGINDKANLTLISRGQWVGIEGTPFLHTLIGSTTFSNHSAAGISVVSDNYGINSDTEIQLNYAYRIEMLDRTLSFGLQGGIVNLAQNFNKLEVEVSDDPLVGSGRQSQSATTFGFGMMYKTKLFFLGAAAPRLSTLEARSNEAQLRSLSAVYNLSGGLFIPTIRGFLVKPSFLVSYMDDDWLVDLNGQVLIGEKVWLGASLRNFNAAGFSFIYTEDDVYHFGYAFQMPFNELNSIGYGTHELMLSIDMSFGKRHKLDMRYF